MGIGVHKTIEAAKQREGNVLAQVDATEGRRGVESRPQPSQPSWPRPAVWLRTVIEGGDPTARLWGPGRSHGLVHPLGADSHGSSSWYLLCETKAVRGRPTQEERWPVGRL